MNLFQCPFCQKDSVGNHAWNCPLNPININNEQNREYKQHTYFWSNDSISEKDEIKFRLREVNRQIDKLLKEKDLLEKGILPEVVIKY